LHTSNTIKAGIIIACLVTIACSKPAPEPASVPALTPENTPAALEESGQAEAPNNAWREHDGKEKKCEPGEPGCGCFSDYNCNKGAECYWGYCYGPGFPAPQTYRYTDAARSDPQNTRKLILSKLELKEGMNVADIGAGRGSFTFYVADRIGEGKIYATDIDPHAVKEMKKNLGERTNVIPVFVKGRRATGIESAPNGSLDLILMINSASFTKGQERSANVQYLKSFTQKLTKGGKFMFHMDWIDPVEGMNAKELTALFHEAGFAAESQAIPMPSHIPELTYYLKRPGMVRKDLKRGYILIFTHTG
jgi:SAM-dependent methyltransferase